jgi:hypothetical protein
LTVEPRKEKSITPLFWFLVYGVLVVGFWLGIGFGGGGISHAQNDVARERGQLRARMTAVTTGGEGARGLQDIILYTCIALFMRGASAVQATHGCVGAQKQKTLVGHQKLFPLFPPAPPCH